MTQQNPISEKLKLTIINFLSKNREECDSLLLKEWLDEREENRRLFRQLVNLWETDQLAIREKDFNPDSAWKRLESQMNRQKPNILRLARISPFIRYAAVFILALLLGGTGYHFLQKQAEVATAVGLVEYTAPYGSKTQLKLLDGSLVWLNAGTTLTYNQGFGSKNRNIRLSGEAYFEVAKNAELPFTVQAKEIVVKALGTKFNVKAYPEEKNIETILLEGSVKIWNEREGEQKNIRMHPDQKALFNIDHNNFSLSDIANTSEVSWITDNWVIKNTNMDELAKLLQRRYNLSFIFTDEKIKDYEFGGTIRNETIEQILTAITYSAPINYRIINNQVTLSIDTRKLKQYKEILK